MKLLDTHVAHMVMQFKDQVDEVKEQVFKKVMNSREILTTSAFVL